MNPLKLAQSLGYNKEDILKFLSKANPQFSSSITKAMAAGYTGDQVMQYLSKAMAGQKVDKKLTRAAFNTPNVADITSRVRNAPEPGGKASQLSVLGGLAGAGVGLATGGPIGAAVGAATGYKSMDKLVNAYQDETMKGGSVPFGEFVKKLALGTAVAGVAGSQVGPLQEAAKEYLSSLGNQEGQQPDQPDQPQPDQPQPDQPGLPQVSLFGPQEAFEIIKSEGLDDLFNRIDAKSPEDMMLTLSKLIGKPRLIELSKKYGKPIEEIVGNAFMMKQGAQEVQQPEAMAPEAQQAPVIDQQMAPQIPVEEIQAQEQIVEQVVKPLDIEEKKKTSPIKSKEPTTEDEKAIAKIMQDVPAKLKATPLTSKDVKPIEALKSSTVRGATYHPDKTLQVVFQNGQAYQYDNVDKEDVEDFLAGASTTTTDGESVFRAFYSGKDPSIGSGFDKFIKKNADKYPPKKIDKSEIRDKGLNSIRKADQVEKASLYFDKFLEHNERAKSGQVKVKVKELSDSLKGLSSDTENEIIYQIRQMIKKESEERKKSGKKGIGLTPKNIAKEIDKRLKK